jgi:Ca-activated chloride channel family protein
MKALTVLLMLVALFIDPTKIGKINTLKAEAKKAYQSGDYQTAIKKYRYLVDSLQVQEDEVLLNLANAYFQTNDTTQALSQYQSLSQSSKTQLRSKAEQQLGVMANRAGKSEEALNHFKQAIKNDPTNEDARYNYELLKKKLEEKKKQEQQKQDQNKDQQQNKEEEKDKKDQEKQDQKKEQEQKKDEQNKDQDQKDQQEKKNEEQKKKEEQEQKENKEEKKEENPSVSKKLQQMEMSEEKAKMILEAMKNQEIQYLQQNKRKATKPKDKGKPDW